jgi:hypothetical protein
MKAYVAIREQPHYRRDAFITGLKACGYDVRLGTPQTWDRDTVFCCWNRYNENHQHATRLEKAGGTVIVAENGYVGPGGVSPHDMEPRQIYALAIGGHNGSGTWPVGGPERWEALGVELKPWSHGEHILVCPNRSFGRPDLIMPLGWERKTVERLKQWTDRPIRIRPHPGNAPAKVPLAKDLENCSAVVVWSSSAGVHALAEGIPVFQCAPHWICEGAASKNLNMIEDPACDSERRLSAFQRLAWAQWHVDEIATGVPFQRLCTATPRATSTA